MSNDCNLLSKRKLLLKDNDQDKDLPVEEIILDDEEIEDLFSVRSQSKVSRPLTFYSVNENTKPKSNKQKEKQTNNKNEIKNDQNDFSLEKRFKSSSSSNHSPAKSMKSTNSAKLIETSTNCNDGLICLDSDEESNSGSIKTRNQLISKSKINCAMKSIKSSIDIDDDEILISSTSNSPATLDPIDNSFDQFDPNLMPANYTFVRNLSMKFKYSGSIHCVQFKSTDKFKDKLDEICKILSIDNSSIIMMFDKKTISFEESPESLGIGITDIIDVFAKKKDNNLVEDKEDPNLFKLKFRDCESRKRIQDVILKMSRYDTFAKIFNEYAKIKDVPLDQCKFEFDGEKVCLNQKPDDLDMEDESLIDVYIRNG